MEIRQRPDQEPHVLRFDTPPVHQNDASVVRSARAPFPEQRRNGLQIVGDQYGSMPPGGQQHLSVRGAEEFSFFEVAQRDGLHVEPSQPSHDRRVNMLIQYKAHLVSAGNRSRPGNIRDSVSKSG